MKPSTEHDWARMSLGQYLQLRGYSDTFRTCYVLPMCAAVWSVPEAQVRAPATPLPTFCQGPRVQRIKSPVSGAHVCPRQPQSAAPCACAAGVLV
jgi:predicted NAD/FAD-binding protein